MRRARGFTLIELLVGMAIMALIMGGAIYGVRALARTDLRGSSSKLAGAIRYCFDRSVTTGSYYRLVLDLDQNRYWAERSDNRVYIRRDKEQSPGKGQAFDSEALEKKKDEQEAKEKQELASRSGNLGAALEPPPKPRRAKFQTFKDTALPTVSLKKTKLFDIYTPRQREPYTSGKAYLYFFPDGHTERAVLRLTDGDDFYSLIIHPLTGRVEVKPGKYEIPREFDTLEEGK
jgi:general secretion pathway protein H